MMTNSNKSTNRKRPTYWNQEKAAPSKSLLSNCFSNDNQRGGSGSFGGTSGGW